MASESKHVAAWLAKHAEPGEEIVAWADGYIGKMMGQGADRQHNGALIVTGRRVAFYRKGVFGEVHRTIPLAKVSSVEHVGLLGHRVLRIHTSGGEGAGIEFKTFDGEECARAAGAIEAGRHGKRESGATSPEMAAGEAVRADPLEALRKLGELRTAGVIGEEEFVAKKAELLGRV
jgi:hypothetical protein